MRFIITPIVASLLALAALLALSSCTPYDAARQAEQYAQQAERLSASAARIAAVATEKLEQARKIAEAAKSVAEASGNQDAIKAATIAVDTVHDLQIAAGKTADAAAEAQHMANEARQRAADAKAAAEAGGGWMDTILAALGGAGGVGAIAAGILKGVLASRRAALEDAVRYGQRVSEAETDQDIAKIQLEERTITAANGTRGLIKAALDAVRPNKE